MALVIAVSGVKCATSVGEMCTGSSTAFGLLGLSFHCLPHPTREGFLLFSSMAHRQHIILGHPVVLEKLLLVPLSILPEAAVEPVHPKWCQSGTLPLDSLPLDEHSANW